MRTILLQLAFITSLWFALGAQPLTAETLYKVVDEDGRVTYTDKPPEESDKAEVTEIPISSDQNIIKNPNGKTVEQRNQELNQQIEERKERDKSAIDQYQSNLTSAQKTLQNAEQALESGLIGQKGDWLGKKNGGARPSPQRLSRIESLENNVDQAKKHLQTVKKSKPQLY